MFFSWHSRIIWLGDLNYRIALSYRCAKALVEMRNWRALLENDQACQKPLGRISFWFCIGFIMFLLGVILVKVLVFKANA